MARTMQLWLVLLCLPLLAYSQITVPNVQPTSTINSQADATALAASAPTFTGSILISPTASDTIDLDGLTSITGNLLGDGASSLITLKSDTLTSIGAVFRLNMSSFTTLSMPNLQSVGGAFLIGNNPRVTNISLPLLRTVGAQLEEWNNQMLTSIWLGNLQTVGGMVELDGSITTLSLGPGLNVTGDFNMYLTSNFDCIEFERSSLSPRVSGNYYCTSNLNTYNLPSEFYSRSYSAGQKAGIVIGAAAGAFLIAVGGGYLFQKWRRHRAVKAGRMHKDHDIMLAERRGIPELVDGNVSGLTEDEERMARQL